MSEAAQFSVRLHHLTREISRAGSDCADVQLGALTPDKLREMLEKLAHLAPSVNFPAEPEVRITGPQGQFLVQVRNGHVRMVSWSAQQGGSDLPPDRILAIIMGLEQSEDGELGRNEAKMSSPRVRGSKIALLAFVLFGSNGFTAWMLTRPSPPPPIQLLPEYRIVTPERAERMLTDFAGVYETGRAEGDRRLSIKADGTMQWTEFGPPQRVADETALTAQAAESHNRPVLIASNHGMIEMKDPLTLLYFNDTYRRISR
jgi:hypothetical protein